MPLASKPRIRLLAALLGTAVAATSLAGCSSDGAETIRFAFSKREAIPWITDLVNEYNASQDDVHVVLDTSGVDPVAASFVRGNPPDIALANYNMETSRFVQRCVLSDLSETTAASSIMDGLDVLMDQYGHCEGRTSALPYSVMASAVIYNKEIFAQYDLEVPTTWDELIEVCETLKANGVDPFYGTFKDGWTIGQGWFDFTTGGMVDTVSFFDQLAQQGTDIGPDSPVSFQSDFLAPVERMRELGHTYTNKDANNKAYNDGNYDFANGKGAMYLQGPWAIVEISKILEDGGIDPAERIGTFPLPMSDDPDANAVRVNMDLAAWIPEASRHKEAATAFLEYLYQPEVIEAYNESQLGFTPTKGSPAVDDPRMEGAYAAYEAGKVYQGASVLVHRSVPIMNYMQNLMNDGDPSRMLRTIDADIARIAFRQ
ncbi:ABC transporter substrate-binding protein [Microbacterium sp. No. 7]|uniref:ABC transporter substrate-binding protein n=1 Tax=Microbacterium sp. No. 7 TaxID=1714373 RepID=UPI0006CFEE94|nr:ABC transporter substrate-binding protein [Microbacterium sp. No. 7]ALJ22152.1 carbohydrate-binding protein [Microbacterium sp. No. 7]